MNERVFQFSKRRALAAPLFVLCLILCCRLALASNSAQVSGTYWVVQKTNLGQQEQIQLHIHLVNHGAASLLIQRMTIWDFSHPEKGGTRTCTLALGARSFTDTTQEFTIRRADYQMWEKGMKPRLMLEVAGPGKSRSRTMVRLDRDSSQGVR
ncbi:MAG: hypothetical protein WBS24_16525 [Terriglobales bacterium]